LSYVGEEKRKMKIRIAFYKYTKKPLNAFIALWTWLLNIGTPSYSHVEIGFEGTNEWSYYSSTLRGDSKGTRWIRESAVIKHPYRWDVYEIEVDYVVHMMSRANSIVGNDYDLWGLIGFILPFGLFNSKKKWYCSEAVYYVLTGLWKRRISPRRLFSYISNKFKLKKI